MNENNAIFTEELYEQYRRECQTWPDGGALSFDEFHKTVGARLETMDRVSVDRPPERGVLYYRLYEEEARQVCVIPVYGYFASSEKVLTQLFSRLSEELVSRKSTRFGVHLYAHDLAAQRLFAMMQFGYMAETGILLIAPDIAPVGAEIAIRTLSKAEIAERWDEIWQMTSSILRHLRQAPVFYPCEEFTEEVYRDFFLDEETRLHAAFDETGKLVGMIETNGELCALLAAPSANVGEIYVPAEKRGSGLSDALLSYAAQSEKTRGAQYLWVEHGTANPQARGFWGRHFESFEYELDRTVEKL